jgi:hypothetical protein
VYNFKKIYRENLITLREKPGRKWDILLFANLFTGSQISNLGLFEPQLLFPRSVLHATVISFSVTHPAICADITRGERGQA